MLTLKTYLVEGNPLIRHNLIAALEELTTVEFVGTAEDQLTAEAWLADGAHECELLIIAASLRRGSGLDVLRWAHRMPRPPAVVVLSDFNSPEMQQRCIAMGALRVFDLSKEFDDLVSFCAGFRALNDRDRE